MTRSSFFHTQALKGNKLGRKKRKRLKKEKAEEDEKRSWKEGGEREHMENKVEDRLKKIEKGKKSTRIRK